jgi:hypothetical protein
MMLLARRFYHYTALHHAEKIMQSGGLTRGGIPIPDPSGQDVGRALYGWQWLTKDDDWAQGWATNRLVTCDRTEVRFVVEIPLLERHRCRQWDAVAADFGFRPHTNAVFAACVGGDSSTWYVFEGSVPRGWLTAIERRPGLGDGVPICLESLRDARRPSS